MSYDFLPVEIKQTIHFNVYKKAHNMMDFDTMLWLSKVNKLCNNDLKVYIAGALGISYLDEINDINYRITIYSLKIDHTTVAKLGRYKPGVYCGLYLRSIQFTNKDNDRYDKYVSIRHNTEKTGLLIDDRGKITGIDLIQMLSKIELDV